VSKNITWTSVSNFGASIRTDRNWKVEKPVWDEKQIVRERALEFAMKTGSVE
jgi:hypothetical protein